VPIVTRSATDADVEAIVELVNRAYEVECFFVEGDRTSAEDIRHELATGTMLVVDRPDRSLAACVFVKVSGERGYFGLLAVDQADQGRGLGPALIHAAEDFARSKGATVMDITVVNVRTNLLKYYRRLGYVADGTEPYVHRPVLQPVHFVKMSKPLVVARG
jgi:GNAT superfamily N-acetyltransferase